MRIHLLVSLAAIALVCQSFVHADDWPQWMGPERDNTWREKGIISAIPKNGFKKIWTAKVAGGYAGPAVAGGRVFVTDFVSSDDPKIDNFDRNTLAGTERVLCLDEKTGKEIWKHEYPVKYSISYPAGPRVTPTVDGDLVYTLGAEGDLIAFVAATGKIAWEKNLRETYKAKTPLWGYSAHPLIDGDKLITLAGGEDSHAVALNKKTGEEIWRALSVPEIGTGYSPPVIIEAAGKRQLLLVKPDALASVDPETGSELWSVPYEADNGSIIMTPLRWKDFVVTGGFNGRNLLVKLDTDKPGAETVWKDIKKAGISPVNVQPRIEGDLLYGIDGGGELLAMEIESGKHVWKTPKPVTEARAAQTGTAFMIKHEDHYWIFTDSGHLALGKMDAKGYTEQGRAKVIEPTNTSFGRAVVWCAPAFANKHMYVRNDEELVCIDLAK
jgi:outer membrane protein assembly factor BamB